MEVDGSRSFSLNFSWLMAVGEPAVHLPGCIFWFIFKDSVSFGGVRAIASSSNIVRLSSQDISNRNINH